MTLENIIKKHSVDLDYVFEGTTWLGKDMNPSIETKTITVDALFTTEAFIAMRREIVAHADKEKS